MIESCVRLSPIAYACLLVRTVLITQYRKLLLHADWQRAR